MPDHQPHAEPGKRRPSSAAAALACLAAALVTLAGPRPALAINELSAPSVSPLLGDTTEPFTFNVRYVSTQSSPAPASSVVARLSGVDESLDVPLTLQSGTDVDGTYGATRLLPVGAWSVTFVADAASGNDPTLSGPALVVETPGGSPAPTVTPTPSLPSTPAASASPTAPPAGSTPPPSGASPPGGASPVPTPLPGVAVAPPDPARDEAGTVGGATAAGSGRVGPRAPGGGASAARSPGPSGAAVDAAAPGSGLDAEAAASDGPLAWLLIGGAMAAIGLFVVVVQAVGLRERPTRRAR